MTNIFSPYYHNHGQSGKRHRQKKTALALRTMVRSPSADTLTLPLSASASNPEVTQENSLFTKLRDFLYLYAQWLSYVGVGSTFALVALSMFVQNFLCNRDVVENNLPETFPSLGLSSNGPKGVALVAGFEAGVMNMIITAYTSYTASQSGPFMRRALSGEFWKAYAFITGSAALSAITPGGSAAAEVKDSGGSTFHAILAVVSGFAGNFGPNFEFCSGMFNDLWDPRTNAFWLHAVYVELQHKLAAMPREEKIALFIAELGDLKQSIQNAPHPASAKILQKIDSIITKLQESNIIEATALINSSLPNDIQQILWINMAMKYSLTEYTVWRRIRDGISLFLQLFAMMISTPFGFYTVAQPMFKLMQWLTSFISIHWTMELASGVVAILLGLWALPGNLAAYRSGAKFIMDTLFSVLYTAQRQWHSGWQQKTYTAACFLLFYQFGWSSFFCGTHGSAASMADILDFTNSTLYKTTGTSFSQSTADGIITASSFGFAPFPAAVNVLFTHQIANMILQMFNEKTSDRFPCAKKQTELDAFSKAVGRTDFETFSAHPCGTEEHTKRMQEVEKVAKHSRNVGRAFRDEGGYNLCGFFGVGDAVPSVGVVDDTTETSMLINM